MPQPPEFTVRQSAGEVRCVDCLRDILLSQDVTDAPMRADVAPFMLGGDSLCSKHAKQRLGGS